MDLKQLSYFISVADAQGFARAGSKLRMSQPALSRQVRALESELGMQLFIRHGRGVTLTEAGVLLREHANGILRHVDKVKSEISERALQPSGELRVGLPAAFRDLVTPGVIGAFNERYPGVSLLVMELTSVGREEAVAAGLADLAVVTAIDSDSTLVSQPLVSESLLLVGAPSAGLSADRPVDLEELARLPLVQNTLPNGVRLVLERAMARRGLAPRTALEVDSQPVTIKPRRAGRPLRLRALLGHPRRSQAGPRLGGARDWAAHHLEDPQRAEPAAFAGGAHLRLPCCAPNAPIW